MKSYILSTFCIFAFFTQCVLCNTYRTYTDVMGGADESTDRSHYPSTMCMDIRPQHSVDIEHITGLWHAREIIMHTPDVPGITNYNICITVELTDITSQMQNYNNHRQYNDYQYQNHQQQQQHQSQGHNQQDEYSQTKYLRLLWIEADNNVLEYTFNYTQLSPGLWTNMGDQRGSMTIRKKYNQFSGTAQVVKAVNDHLVLTFCGEGLKSDIYTVVLSRTSAGLNSEELRSIRSLLSRRGLPTESVRKICSNGASALKTPALILFALLFCVRYISKKYY